MSQPRFQIFSFFHNRILARLHRHRYKLFVHCIFSFHVLATCDIHIIFISISKSDMLSQELYSLVYCSCKDTVFILCETVLTSLIYEVNNLLYKYSALQIGYCYVICSRFRRGIEFAWERD